MPMTQEEFNSLTAAEQLEKLQEVLYNTLVDGENASKLWQEPAGVLQLRNGDFVANLRKRLEDFPYENFISFFSSRLEAEQTNVEADTSVVVVVTPSGALSYVRAEEGETNVALVTGDNSEWVPLSKSHVSPQHYAENTTPGVTDMTAAVKSALKFVSYGVVPNNTFGMHGPASDLETRRVDLMGENLGVSSPIIVGDLDTNLNGFMDKIGSGIMAGTVIKNGSLVALSNFDTTSLATFNHSTQGVVETVPAYVLVMGTYDTYDRKVSMPHKSYVTDIKVDIAVDCGFVTGGIYLENTLKVVLNESKVVNIAHEKVGILTSVSNPDVTEPNLLGNFNARGVATKNPELHIVRPYIAGRNRSAGTGFPTAVEADHKAIAMKILCADFHITDMISTATSGGDLIFDCFNNGQFTGAHPWGTGGLIFGPDCEGITGDNVYLDHSDMVFYSFEHSVSGIAARAGDANVRLVSTRPNENALNLVINGLNANGASTLVYDVDATLDAGASWVTDGILKHTLSEVNIEAAHSFKEYVPDSHYVTSTGALHYLTDQINLDQFSSTQTTIGAKRGIILGADVDDNSSGDARKISFQSRGVERAFIDHAEAQFNVPITGDAVQANKTDTTGGRLMSVGAFGLGITGTPNTLSDLDAFDTPTGLYRTTGATANIANKPVGASGFSTVFFERYDFDNAKQTYTETAGPFRTFIRNLDQGVWSDWQTLYTTGNILGTVSEVSGVPTGAVIERGSNVNGDYVKFADGTMIANVNMDLTQSATEKVDDTWTFPNTFLGAPSIMGSIDRNTVAANATPSPSDLGPIMTASESDTSAIVEVYRITGTTNFGASDTITVRLTAIGRWF